MRVGIDMDGVMTNFERYVKENGSKYVNKDIVNPWGKEIAEIFEVPLETEDAFWKAHIQDYVENCPPRERLREFVKILGSLNISIIAITNRCSDLTYCGWKEDTMKYWVEKWIHSNIGPIKVVYTYKSKLKACIEENIDVMIEDSVEHIKELSEHIKVIKIRASYNVECKGKNIFEANSFDKVLDIILKIKAEKDIERGTNLFL